MKTVYIASPYTNEDSALVLQNVTAAMNIAEELFNSGFIPFMPLLNHYYETFHFHRSWKDWMDYDLTWLSKCDYVLRLPGKSKGADIEVKKAQELYIPVLYSIEDLIKYEIVLKTRLGTL